MSQSKVIQLTDSLNHRVADYFLMTGYSADQLEDMQTNPGCASQRPELLFRYPLTDYQDAPLLPGAADFTFPAGVRVLELMPPAPSFFTFVLTDEEGKRTYGATLVFSEPVTASHLITQKAFCIISRWPFYTMFKLFLKQLYRLSVSSPKVPLERYVRALVTEIPLPPPGRLKVKFEMGGDFLVFQRPAVNELPLVDIHYDNVFRALKPEDIVTAVVCLLSEKKILVRSSQIAMLTPVCEALVSFMFPFEWHYVYVPVLPASLYDYLHAPMPFVMGQLSSAGDFPEELEDSVVIVDLDRHEVRVPPDCAVKLPKKQTAKLVKRITQYSGTYDPNHAWLGQADLAYEMTPRLDDEAELNIQSVRTAFLNYLASIFRNYRNFLGKRASENPFEWMDVEGFIRSSPASSRPLLAQMANTQAMAKYIERCMRQRRAILSRGAGVEFTVRYFDETIDAKLNRSKLTITKKRTPFLSTNRFVNGGTYLAPRPDLADLVNYPDKRYSYSPRVELSNELCGTPRPVKPLIVLQRAALSQQSSLPPGLPSVPSAQKLPRIGSERNLTTRSASTGSLLKNDNNGRVSPSESARSRAGSVSSRRGSSDAAPLPRFPPPPPPKPEIFGSSSSLTNGKTGGESSNAEVATKTGHDGTDASVPMSGTTPEFPTGDSGENTPVMSSQANKNPTPTPPASPSIEEPVRLVFTESEGSATSAGQRLTTGLSAGNVLVQKEDDERRAGQELMKFSWQRSDNDITHGLSFRENNRAGGTSDTDDVAVRPPPQRKGSLDFSRVHFNYDYENPFKSRSSSQVSLVHQLDRVDSGGTRSTGDNSSDKEDFQSMASTLSLPEVFGESEANSRTHDVHGQMYIISPGFSKASPVVRAPTSVSAASYHSTGNHDPRSGATSHSTTPYADAEAGASEFTPTDDFSEEQAAEELRLLREQVEREREEDRRKREDFEEQIRREREEDRAAIVARRGMGASSSSVEMWGSAAASREEATTIVSNRSSPHSRLPGWESRYGPDADKEVVAAISIQAAVRGHQGRGMMRRRSVLFDAATLIQKIWRGHIVRIRFLYLQAKAIYLQRVYRAYRIHVARVQREKNMLRIQSSQLGPKAGFTSTPVPAEPEQIPHRNSLVEPNCSRSGGSDTSDSDFTGDGDSSVGDYVLQSPHEVAGDVGLDDAEIDALLMVSSHEDAGRLSVPAVSVPVVGGRSHRASMPGRLSYPVPNARAVPPLPRTGGVSRVRRNHSSIGISRPSSHAPTLGQSGDSSTYSVPVITPQKIADREDRLSEGCVEIAVNPSDMNTHKPEISEGSSNLNSPTDAPMIQDHVLAECAVPTIRSPSSQAGNGSASMHKLSDASSYLGSYTSSESNAISPTLESHPMRSQVTNGAVDVFSRLEHDPVETTCVITDRDSSSSGDGDGESCKDEASVNDGVELDHPLGEVNMPNEQYGVKCDEPVGGVFVGNNCSPARNEDPTKEISQNLCAAGIGSDESEFSKGRPHLIADDSKENFEQTVSVTKEGGEHARRNAHHRSTPATKAEWAERLLKKHTQKASSPRKPSSGVERPGDAFRQATEGDNNTNYEPDPNGNGKSHGSSFTNNGVEATDLKKILASRLEANMRKRAAEIRRTFSTSDE